MLSNKIGIQELVALCAAHGITDIISSPGSRNAPIISSFHDDDRFVCRNFTDERVAAFVAMGIGQAKRKPAAVISTSGSAALNYAPAIVEARYQNIPLLVITADRPVKWRDQGNGQTINQKNLYANYIKKSFEIPQDEGFDAWQNNRMINEGINLCTTPPYGPVHLNVPMAEPLYDFVEKSTVVPRVIERITTNPSLTPAQCLKFEEEWEQCSKVLLLIGQQPLDEQLLVSIQKLSALPQVAVLAENTSNIFGGDIISCIDRTIKNISDDSFYPDLLVTMGGAIVSKRIKAWLRKGDIKRHWHIGVSFPETDTYQCLTKRIAMPANDFLHILEDRSVSSEYADKWQALNQTQRKKHDTYFDTCPYSDLKVFQLLKDHVAGKVSWHFANSAGVRYGQLFDPKEEQLYFANRGTSGIDGCTSTAIGASLAKPESRNILLTGDLAFMYDSNALWHKFKIPNLKIIVINNGGGGIFRFIHGPSSSSASTEFLETQHERTMEHLARHHNCPYVSAKTEKELLEVLPTFLDWTSTENHPILEIFTPREENDLILKDYFKHLMD